ncbi:hypothetical protein HYFRA_00006154 [Hymenoscyphus fraxineus]|uniref:SUN domain-containing protein n=1 Tax=Hymenoscyphus fraxineus TaxID=746836 RepID=A0A9N9LDS4_9HELO|nr:hypothetical protein HYFRA_00006154 [Hymenoscyphus fraxineus]
MPPRRNASNRGPTVPPTRNRNTRRTVGLDPGIQIRTANSYGDPSPPLPRPVSSTTTPSFTDVIRNLEPEPIRDRPESGRVGTASITYAPDPNRNYGDESSINRGADFDDSSVVTPSSGDEGSGIDESEEEPVEEVTPVRQSPRVSSKNPSPPTRISPRDTTRGKTPSPPKSQDPPTRASSRTGSSGTTRVSPPTRGSRRGSEVVEAPTDRGSRRGTERGSDETIFTSTRGSRRGSERVSDETVFASTRGSRRGSERVSDEPVVSTTRGSRRGSEAVESSTDRGSRRGTEKGSDEPIFTSTRGSRRGSEVVEPSTDRGSRRGTEKGSDEPAVSTTRGSRRGSGASVRGSPRGSPTKSGSPRNQDDDGETMYEYVLGFFEWMYLNVKEFISTIFFTIGSSIRSAIDKTYASIVWIFWKTLGSLWSGIAAGFRGIEALYKYVVIGGLNWLWEQLPAGFIKDFCAYILTALMGIIYFILMFSILYGIYRAMKGVGSRILSPSSSSVPGQSEPYNWNVADRVSNLNPITSIKDGFSKYLPSGVSKDGFSKYLPSGVSKDYDFTAPQNEKLVDAAFADLPEYVAVTIGEDGRTTVPDQLWAAINDKTRAVDSSGPVTTGLGSSGKKSAPIWDKFVSDNAKQISAIQSADPEMKKQNPKYFESNRMVPKKNVIDMIRQSYKEQQPSMGPELKKLAAKLEKAEKELQKLQSNRGGGVSETRARELVSDGISALLVNNQLQGLAEHILRGNINNGMNRINHWSRGTGAVVDGQLTSPNYVFPFMDRGWLSKQFRRAINNPVPAPNPPTAALERWEEHGDCWCSPSKDDKGYGPTIGVISSHHFYPDQIIVEHIAPAASIAPGATPKNMELLAYIEDFDAYDKVIKVSNHHFDDGKDLTPKHEFHYVKIASWTYDANGTMSQSFTPQIKLKDFSAPVNRLVLRAKDNWGDNIPYTCLYRVKMHGDIHPEELVKSRAIKKDED